MKFLSVEVIAVEMRVTKTNVPAGTLRWDAMLLSMTKARRTVKLNVTPIGVLKRMLVDHSGISMMDFLRSSTSSTVHWLHDLFDQLLEFIPCRRRQSGHVQVTLPRN